MTYFQLVPAGARRAAVDLFIQCVQQQEQQDVRVTRRVDLIVHVAHPFPRQDTLVANGTKEVLDRFVTDLSPDQSQGLAVLFLENKLALLQREVERVQQVEGVATP